MAETVTIGELGHAGDGIYEADGRRLFVPYALAGETVEIEREGNRGRLLRVVTPAPERTDPACRHFGTCGGCALQHMGQDAYLAWKRDVVRRAFLLQRIDAPVEPVVATPPGTRRRAILSAINLGGHVILGFHRRGGD